MAMTRKDYQLLATTLNEQMQRYSSPTPIALHITEALLQLTRDLSSKLSTEYPNFDKAQFLDAAVPR